MRDGIVYICAQTAARVWQNADEKHKETNPKMPRQANPRVLICYFPLCLHQHACVLLTPYRGSVIIFVFILCACLLPSCFISVQSWDSHLSSAQKCNTHSFWCMKQRQPCVCKYYVPWSLYLFKPCIVFLGAAFAIQTFVVQLQSVDWRFHRQ